MSFVGMVIHKSIVVSFLPCLVAFLGITSLFIIFPVTSLLSPEKQQKQVQEKHFFK